MDPTQLQKMLASGDSEQIKEAQRVLQGLGFYKGAIDGVLQAKDGTSKTFDAMAAYERDQQASAASERDAQIRKQELEAQRAQAEAQKAETERLRLASEQEAQRRTEAESPYEQGRQIALFGAPAAVGLGGGYLEGRQLSGGLKERATERAGNVRELADSVRGGEISRSDAARTARDLKLSGRTRHGVAPMLFGSALAGIGVGQRALAPNMTENPTGQDVIRALGGLESGVGTGLMLQQVGSMIKGVPQPRASDAAMITDAPPNQPGGGSPPPPRIDPRELEQRFTRDQLRDQAKKAGLQTSGTKTDLATRLAAHDGPIKATGAKPKAIGKAAMKALPKPSVLLPAAAAATAADAYLSDAQAANTEVEAGTGAMSGGQPTSASDLAGAGAVGAGVGAGTYAGVKGVERAGQALSGTTLGRAAGRAIPGAGAAITAYDLASGINERIPPDATDPVERGARSIPAAGMGMIEMQSSVQGAFESALSELMSLMQGEGPDQSQGPLVP